MRERSKPASSPSKSGKKAKLWRWLLHSTPRGLVLAACSLALVVNLCVKGEGAYFKVRAWKEAAQCLVLGEL